MNNQKSEKAILFREIVTECFELPHRQSTVNAGKLSESWWQDFWHEDIQVDDLEMSIFCIKIKIFTK